MYRGCMGLYRAVWGCMGILIEAFGLRGITGNFGFREHDADSGVLKSKKLFKQLPRKTH